MKKITAFFFLITSMQGVFAQKSPKQTAIFHYMEVPTDTTLVEALKNMPDMAIVENRSPDPKDIIITSPKEPLYVIDGVVVTEGIFKKIADEDIESINLLRPSADTPFTSHLRNTIVIIKTKKGFTRRELRKLDQEQKAACKKEN